MKLRILWITVLCLGLSACATDSEDLAPVPPKVEDIHEKTGDPQELVFRPMVDILFVIDDSGSMSKYQTNLASNINQFTREFVKFHLLDYHIGVVTTDMSDPSKRGRLQGLTHKYVDNQTPDLIQVLANNLMVGDRGDYTEASFDPVVAALSEPLLSSTNAGFYRKDAHIVVIFLTDSEDQSQTSPEGLFDFLLKLKRGDHSKVISYGAIIPVGSNIRNCTRDHGEPHRFERFFRIINGIFFNICSPDFGTKLAELGRNLNERVGNFIPLGQIPYVPSIHVQYGSQVIPNHPRYGWSYDSSRVGLYFGPDLELKAEPKGTELEVRFIPADLE